MEIKRVITMKKLRQEMNDNDKTIVYYHEDWCSPCRVLQPVINELAKEYGDINFVSASLDKIPESREEFRVGSIPDVLLVDSGEIKSRFVGFRNKNQIIRLLEELKWINEAK